MTKKFSTKKGGRPEPKCASHKTQSECNENNCLWGKTGKCSKKREGTSKKTKEPVPQKANLSCKSHKTQSECNENNCLWGKTGKCSKKREGTSKKTKEPVVQNLKVSPNKIVYKQPMTKLSPEAKQPTKDNTKSLDHVYLESHESGSNKFYEIYVTKNEKGYLLDQKWGPIGKDFRRNKDWPRPQDYYETLESARAEIKKVVDSKLKKGYVVVDSSSNKPEPVAAAAVAQSKTSPKASKKSPTKAPKKSPKSPKTNMSEIDETGQIPIYPLLYGIEKGGKTKIWSAKIEYDPSTNIAVQIFTFGQLDGKQQIASKEYTKGRGNRSPLEQCIQETNRKWIDKKEKKAYTTVAPGDESPASEDGPQMTDSSGTHLPLPILPMLAKKFEPEGKKKRNDIVFPCFVQPKLDGLRCVMYLHKGKVVAQSRTGNHFKSMDDITDSLIPFFEANPQVVLDGELYTKDIPFEVLAGLIKRQKKSDEDTEILNLITYNVYDMVDLKAPFIERISFLEKHFSNGKYPKVKFVETHKVADVNEFRKMFSEFVVNGFEGIMLRNINGLYRTNYRSDDLQKYKEFIEDEYTIIGFTEGEGHDKGTVIWVCETSDGKKFTVKPRGTIQRRREYFKNGHIYIGKSLTVIFQELTDNGKPRFPVGKDIREGY
jgi:DNA ligase-1